MQWRNDNGLSLLMGNHIVQIMNQRNEKNT